MTNAIKQKLGRSLDATLDISDAPMVSSKRMKKSCLSCATIVPVRLEKICRQEHIKLSFTHSTSQAKSILHAATNDTLGGGSKYADSVESNNNS